MPAIPTSNFPQVRTVTNLIRALLRDGVAGLGHAFIPLSIVTVAGECTATFAFPPGFITGDRFVLANADSDLNGTFQFDGGSGVQFTWPNAAATTGAATLVGTIQGYGTGQNYYDTILIPNVNSAYRELQRALKAAGSTELKTGQSFCTIPGLSGTDPSAQVYLDYAGLSILSDAFPAPVFIDTPIAQLPGDLLMPLKVWERQTGSNNDFVIMRNLTNSGGLPSIPQGLFLRFWEWVEDTIALIGATQDQDIKIEYNKSLVAVGDGYSQLLIENSEEFHAYEAAAQVSKSQGGKNTAEWSQAAEDAKNKLIAAVVRQQQFTNRRMRPYKRPRYSNSRRIW